LDVPYREIKKRKGAKGQRRKGRIPWNESAELIRSKALFKFDSVEFEKAFVFLCVSVSLRLCVEFCLLIFNALHFFYLGGAMTQRKNTLKRISGADPPKLQIRLRRIPIVYRIFSANSNQEQAKH